MSFNVLLTVDLNSVNTKQRQRFYQEMEERKFLKISLTTTWKAQFNEDVSYENAVLICKNDLKNCARLANVVDYEFAMLISKNKVITS
ncbi:hypothetical protein [Acinetobacter sp. ANC 3832]|uniref:hypothetical protein n=1 Tax=Acinetobacter sp. ANC 3832 TaxID=1977874 RepID=UPI000A33A2B2|nr:hypothetical protein [Acinetobacter sp. ANC 3832]OTG94216.1 hypothetical protein B9T35_07360 [Acinetobacter sp. ANC 3832]